MIKWQYILASTRAEDTWVLVKLKPTGKLWLSTRVCASCCRRVDPVTKTSKWGFFRCHWCEIYSHPACMTYTLKYAHVCKPCLEGSEL